MNAELARYNTIADHGATTAGVDVIDVWPALTATATHLAMSSGRTAHRRESGHEPTAG